MSDLFKFRTVNGLKATMTSQGGHYFSRETMRHFDSRPLSTVYAGRVWVDNIRTWDDAGRTYKVRLVEWSADAGYSITTLGERDDDRAGAISDAQRVADIIATEGLPDALTWEETEALRARLSA